MESLRGLGSEISDRVVQKPRTLRDIVLCRLQAVQKGGESIAESSPGYIAAHSVTLQTVRDMLQEPSGARERTTWQSIIHFTVDSFPLHGADGRSQYYVVCDFAHLPEILGWRTGTRHSPEG